MKTDYHSHILPAFDDGAENISESLAMIEMHKKQGIQTVIATPHFYSHRENSIEDYIVRRTAAKSALNVDDNYMNIVLGAEIAIESDISEREGIEKLTIEGTNLMLLEPSYYGISEHALEEVRCISYDYKIKPVIAHLHRYVNFYKPHEIEAFLQLDAIFQVNAEAFQNRKERKFVMQLIDDGYPVVFGSDCHGLSHRPPNFEPVFKQFKKNYGIVNRSDEIFEEHRV